MFYGLHGQFLTRGVIERENRYEGVAMRFEEKYEGVLQNLEYGVMEVYREHPELTDYDAMDAFAALRRHYIREVRQQETVVTSLTERAQKVSDMVEV